MGAVCPWHQSGSVSLGFRGFRKTSCFQHQSTPNAGFSSMFLRRHIPCSMPQRIVLEKDIGITGLKMGDKMKTSKLKLVVGAALALSLTACGSKTNTVVVSGSTGGVVNSGSSGSGVKPTILVVGGYQGYYSGSSFCDYANNYCSTNINWGIKPPVLVVYKGYNGYYSNNVFCNWANNYCGTGLSWGIAPPVIIFNNGYYGYYNNSLFCDYGNNYCGTELSWGIASNGTYCDYTYCGGGITYSNGSSGSTGSVSGSSGSTGSVSGSSGSTGSVSGSSGSTGSVSGSSGSTGSVSGSSGSTGSVSSSGSSSSSGSVSTGGSSGAVASEGGEIKDVDLQRVQQQLASLQSRAEAVASQFQMSVTSAVQLTQLSDRMSTLTTNGQQMTDTDRAALTEAALNVAGITMEDATAATTSMIQTGNQNAANDLLAKAAANLGMTSTATLRDQILPALGINLGQ
jgi:hypothetical protein